MVKAAIDKSVNGRREKLMLKEKFQLDVEIKRAIDIRIRMSPIRLEKMVIHPDLDDFGSW